jgi:hypothetical protein
MNHLAAKLQYFIEPCFILLFIAFLFWIPKNESKPSDVGREINVVTSLLPPYMDENARGKEADIIKAALIEGYRIEGRNVSIRFFIEPFSHHWLSYISDTRYDAVTTVPETVNIPGYRSKPYVNFQNGIGYRKNGFSGQVDDFRLSELAGYRVVAFAGASGIIPGLRKERDTFSLYLEEPNQRIHSKLLAENIVDIVIADGVILSEYNRRLEPALKIPEELFAAVFCETPYAMAFRTVEMKERFNAGLGVISRNGQLDAINNAFLERIPKNHYLDPAKSCNA